MFVDERLSSSPSISTLVTVLLPPMLVPFLCLCPFFLALFLTLLSFRRTEVLLSHPTIHPTNATYEKISPASLCRSLYSPPVPSVNVAVIPYSWNGARSTTRVCCIERWNRIEALQNAAKFTDTFGQMYRRWSQGMMNLASNLYNER